MRTSRDICDCSGSIFESLEPRLLLSSGGADSAAAACSGSAASSAAIVASNALSSSLVTPTVTDTITFTGVKKTYVFGSLIFAAGDAGVQIASMAAGPLNPTVISGVITNASVTAITVSGSTLYIGEADGTVEVVDISTQNTPSVLGSVNVGSEIDGLAFLDNGSGASPERLYVACLADGTNAGGVKVVDVSTPSAPAVLGGFNQNGASVYDVAIVGTGTNGWSKNALAVISGNNVYLLNASDPNSPTLGSYGTYSSPYDLYADGYKLYVTDSKGLHLVTAVSFTSPKTAGSVAADAGAVAPLQIAAAGQIAYLSEGSVGVKIIDTGVAGGPQVIGTYSDATALGVAGYGTTLYVACSDGTWKAVDTGITRDLTVAGTPTDFYYVTPAKTFKVAGEIDNLGDLSVLANQGITVTAYLSADGTLDSSDYQLTPVKVENSGIAALTNLQETWSLKVPSSTAEGFYYLILKLSNGGVADGDLTNDTWVSPAVMVQVIRGKPSISMSLDAASDSGVLGDNITNIQTVSFSGVTRANSAVVLKRGSAVLGTTTSAADGSFSFSGVALVAGSNSLKVVVTDRAGNSATLTEKVVLDTAVGATTFKLDRASDSGKAGDWLTNISPVNLTGKTEKNSTVVLLVGGDVKASTVANSKGDFSFQGVVLSAGANNVTVQVTDVADNMTSVTNTITYEQIAVPPTLALAPESDTGTPGDDITTLSKVSLIGTAEAYSKVTLRVFKNGKYSTVKTVTAAADETFAFSKVSLQLGDNTFIVVATDPAANVASSSSLVVTYQTA